jgi:hypothetical protein
VGLKIHSLPSYVSLPEFQPEPLTLIAEVATLGYLDLSSKEGWLRVATPKGAQVLYEVKGLSAESSQRKLGINDEFRAEFQMTQAVRSQAHKLLLQVSHISARYGEASS